MLETSRGMRLLSRGEGTPLIFLHGWCLSHRMWMYAEEKFSAGYRFVAPDLPGFGNSADLAGPYTLDRYADEVSALISEFDLRGAVLVGFAFGAAVGMTLAARKGHDLRASVAIGAPAAEASPYDKMPKAIRRDWPLFARRSAEALFHNPQSEATKLWLENLFASTSLPVAIDVVHLLSRFDPRPLALQVSIPQLFIGASEDRVSPVAVGEACAATAPAAQFRLIEGCGHLIVLDAKDAFHAVLDEFLRTAGAATATV